MGVGILMSCQLSPAEFSPENERVASMLQHVSGRKAVAVVSAYGLNSNLKYLVSLDSLGEVEGKALPEDFMLG